MKPFKHIFIFLFFYFGIKAQMPNTDVWLFTIETSKTGQTLTNPLNLTSREGYDNQPAFSPDEKKIFYVSVREDNQADIYYYDFKSKKNIQFTKTPESEYSPTFSPDGQQISTVVVERDSSQRIHFLNALNAADEGNLEFDSVGYTTFLNSDTLVYYKLTEPHSLRYYTKNAGDDKWLGNAPVRGFKAINRHTLIYGLKDSTSVSFYKYDFLIRKAVKYCSFNSLNEDIIWHSSLGLLKAEDAQLMRYDEHIQSWKLLFDLESFGIKKITRFIFDSKNKYLVVVNNL